MHMHMTMLMYGMQSGLPFLYMGIFENNPGKTKFCRQFPYLVCLCMYIKRRMCIRMYTHVCAYMRECEFMVLVCVRIVCVKNYINLLVCVKVIFENTYMHTVHT